MYINILNILKVIKQHLKKMFDLYLRVLKVAKKLRDDGHAITFAVSNSKEFQDEIDSVGLVSTSDKPVIAGRGEKDEKYVTTADFR